MGANRPLTMSRYVIFGVVVVFAVRKVPSLFYFILFFKLIVLSVTFNLKKR